MSKSNLELVQEVVEAKLNNLDNKMDLNNKSLTNKIDSNNKYVLELLTRIEVQTTKTNGKVITLDRELKDLTTAHNEHLNSATSPDDIKKINVRIDQLNEENFIVKVWNRYPKAFVTIIVASVLLSIASVGYTMIKVHDTISQITNIEKVK